MSTAFCMTSSKFNNSSTIKEVHALVVLAVDSAVFHHWHLLIALTTSLSGCFSTDTKMCSGGSLVPRPSSGDESCGTPRAWLLLQCR